MAQKASLVEASPTRRTSIGGSVRTDGRTCSAIIPGKVHRMTQAVLFERQARAAPRRGVDEILANPISPLQAARVEMQHRQQDPLASSASLGTGVDRNAALNIWNVTPAEAMLTPCNSRSSPAPRLPAITRNDSRKLSATFWNVTDFSMPQLFRHTGRMHTLRIVAGASAGRLARRIPHAAHVDPDRRQDPLDTRGAAQSLVACGVVCQPFWINHRSHSLCRRPF